MHKRVLVADGNRKFLSVAEQILSAAEIDAITLPGGDRVLGLIETERPDAVLLNASLEVVDGGELCKRIKMQDPCIPVLLMFGGAGEPAENANDEAAELTQKVGADNYLLRPLREKELLFAVRAALRLGRLLTDKRAAEGLTGEEIGEIGSMVGLELFYRFLELEIRRSDRYGFPLAVLSIAIDPLPKDVPETWANTLEKQLSQALAQTIRYSVRSIDISAALSWREVLLLMPHTDVEGACAAGERIRLAVANQPYHFGRTRIQPSVSIGVGLVHGERLPGAQLISAAQSRRMQAAHSGGNKVLP